MPNAALRNAAARAARRGQADQCHLPQGDRRAPRRRSRDRRPGRTGRPGVLELGRGPRRGRTSGGRAGRTATGRARRARRPGPARRAATRPVTRTSARTTVVMAATKRRPRGSTSGGRAAGARTVADGDGHIGAPDESGKGAAGSGGRTERCRDTQQINCAATGQLRAHACDRRRSRPGTSVPYLRRRPHPETARPAQR